MSSASPRVWLDLTVLLNATRAQPTGIPRTAARLLHSWLADGPPGLGFCQLSRTSGGLIEACPGAVLARFPPRPAPPPAPAAPPLPKPPLKRLLGPLRRLVPDRAVHEVKQAARNTYHKLRPPPPPPPLPLGPADVVVSAGGGWVIAGGSELVWQLKRQQGFRLATIIYDLIPILFPHYYGPGFAPHFENWTANTLWASDLLLAISEHTRRDLEAYCADRQVPCPPIEVIRLGEDIAGPAAPPPGLAEGEPFALCVGTVEVRKNHQALHHVWRRLAQARRDAPKLVIAGAHGWLATEALYQLQNDPLTADRVVVLLHADDDQLEWLYRHCLFTLYPSHYEGWGLPIAESLGHGKYCVASGTSSMPEVGGGLIGLHDPCDVPACLRLVEQALDPDFRAARERAIRTGYRRWAWADCARQVAAAVGRHFGPAAPASQEDRDARVATDLLPDSAAPARRPAAGGGDRRRLSA